MSKKDVKSYEVRIDDTILWLYHMEECRQKAKYLETLNPDFLSDCDRSKLDLVLKSLDEVKAALCERLFDFCEEWEELPGCKVWTAPFILGRGKREYL